MKLIAAVDKRFGLGANNDLLFKLKKDMAFFKKQTSGKTVVMGYMTYVSLNMPNGLPNRLNYVITDSLEGLSDTDSVKFVTEVPQAILESDAYLIGGAYTYGKYVDYVDEMFLTHIGLEAENVDVFMPNNVIEKAVRMTITLIEQGEEDGITYRIHQYK